MNNLHINHKRELGLFDRLSLRLAHQSFEESRISRQLNQLDRSTQEERVAAYSANLDFIKSFSNTNSLFYGLEFVHNDVSSLGSIRQINEERVRSGPARYPDAGWTSIAAYINDEIKLGKRATLQAGLRYNLLSLKAGFSNNEAFFPLPQQNSSRHSSALTGSIGAVYRPDKNWIMKASIGTAFRAPNVDDLGKVFDAEPGAVLVPNAGLNPEYAWNADMSLTKVFGDHIKVDIAAYYTYLDQALVRRNFQLDGQDSIRYLGVLSQVQAIQNAAVARVYGIQGGIEVKLPAGFSFSTDINLQQGEEELDDGNLSPSRHAAPFFGQSRLSLHVKDLRMQLYAQYQGGRSHEQLAVGERRKVEIYALDENGNPFAPSWYTLNLKVLHPLSDIFTISAGVENITDRRYRPYSSGISGAGRNFILSLTAKY
jgi:hemoglobin/transferrin/lactoferrin receptor protein